MKKVLIGMLAAVGFLAFIGWNTLPNDDTSIPGPTIFGKRVDIGNGNFYLGNTQVTANADNLNAAASGSIAAGRITNALVTSGASIGGNVPVAAITNAARSVGGSIGGNIPVAAITNAAGSIGSSIGGNVPVAAITNAASTLGPSIGGNILAAAISNALASTFGPVRWTGAITNAGVGGTSSNIMWYYSGALTNVTYLP